MEKTCVICAISFTTKSHNAKTCSAGCLASHRKNRRREQLKPSFVCRHCNCVFSRLDKKNGFCNKSCASKFHIQNGTYKTWQQTDWQLNKDKLKLRSTFECIVCKSYYSVKPKENDRTKTCSKECRIQYTSRFISGSNSHFFGKPFKQVWEEKRKKTLKAKYDVTNALFLAKHRTTSKPQIELFDALKERYSTEDLQLEKSISLTSGKRIFADIVFISHKIIVEYNGDYWHCNPYKYEGNYYNLKKQMLANDIWLKDKERLKLIQNSGFKVFVVWENDFKNNRDETLGSLIQHINEELMEEQLIENDTNILDLNDDDLFIKPVKKKKILFLSDHQLKAS